MSLSLSLLPEFDQEMMKTRCVLERVPESRFTWSPHPRAGSMAWLAGHLATIPEWLLELLHHDKLDIAPAGREVHPPPDPQTLDEVVSTFDRAVFVGRAALAVASDDQLMRPWSLLSNGYTVFTMAKIACYRTYIINHLIHHRGQLCVYLRLTNASVPALYGPSADEGRIQREYARAVM